MATRIEIEVAAASPRRQIVVRLTVPAGTTLIEAVRQADLPGRLPGFHVSADRLGVFGQLRPPEWVLQAGDRAEAYRPLSADPKEIRRRLAESESVRGRRDA